MKELGMDDPSSCPDVGDPRPHPTAGATVVGARKFLVAFNVNLNSADRQIARQIAKAIRTISRSPGGGLTGREGDGRSPEITGRERAGPDRHRCHRFP